MKNEKAKTQVYNVVILDKSGSMNSIRKAAVDGFNETLAGIKKAQEQFAETQQHYLSLVTFCSCEMRKLYDKEPVSEATPLAMEDYTPCCCTPLYDAMGFTLTDIQKTVKEMPDAMVVVTIITDGLENASKEYSGQTVKKMVEDLQKQGWTFTYMGANQNSIEVAMSLSIRNASNFDYTNEGTLGAMAKDSSVRMNLFSKMYCFRMENEEKAASLSASERSHLYTEMANEAFDEENVN